MVGIVIDLYTVLLHIIAAKLLQRDECYNLALLNGFLSTHCKVRGQCVDTPIAINIQLFNLSM